MAKKKYYAVKVGLIPGIYNTWDECQEVIKGYPGAEFKGFATKPEAEAYMRGETQTKPGKEEKPEGRAILVKKEEIENPHPYVFADGSYNNKTGVYGFGGFLCVGLNRYPLQGSGSDDDLSSMWNVAGEICGAMAAVKKAEELGLKELTILYDYNGIEKWAKGEWRTKKEGTKKFAQEMQAAMQHMDIKFEKVKGHSGVEGNEVADAMAKQATGIKLTKKQTEPLGLVY